MDLRRLYLDPKGRIGRKAFWLAVLPILAVDVAVYLLLVPNGFDDTVLEPWDRAQALSALLSLLLLWPLVAVTAKRLHDRNQSGLWGAGYWLLLTLYDLSEVALGTTAFHHHGAILILVLLGSVVIVVEAGLRRGTAGPNRFGPDPLDGGGGSAFPASRSLA